jgi:signal transduction histidine kinase/DNA-binding response OmpR family regulator/streptogramin lyase
LQRYKLKFALSSARWAACCCLIISSQFSVAFAQEMLLRFQHIQPERSFTTGSIVDVTHDRNGFIWFSSLYGGFARFDGSEFKSYRYNPDTPGGLLSSATTCVYADPVEPLIWVCTPEGLAHLNLKTDALQLYRHDDAIKDSLPGNGVYRVLRDSQGILWVGLENGLARQNPGTEDFIHYPLQIDSPQPGNVTPPTWVWDLFEDRTRTLWVATTGGGLLRYDRKTDKFQRFLHDPENASSLPQDSVRAIFEDSSSRLWVGTDRGLAIMQDREAGVFEYWGLDALVAIMEDPQGNLWFAYRNGLALLSPGQAEFRHFEHDPVNPTGLGPGTIWRLHVDPQGNLWTPGNLVSWLPPPALAFSVYKYPEGHVGTEPDLKLDREGRAWVGDVDGLYELNLTTGEWRHHVPFPDSESGRKNWIRGGMFVAPDGTYWAAMNGNFSAFDPETGAFDPLEVPSTPFGPTMTRNGMIWMGLAFRGLASYDPINRTIELYPHDPADPASISHDFAYIVLEGPDGFLWVGTQQGLNRFDRETSKANRYFSQPGEQHALSNSTVRSGLVDSSGGLWFGTEFGLNRYRPGTNDFVHYFNGQHPGDNVIYNILEDADGTFWLRTDSGISLFDPKSGLFRNFDQFDGVPPSGFRNDLNQSADGHLYALTTGGVLRIDKERLRASPKPLSLFWTSFSQVNDRSGTEKRLNPPTELNLDHNDNAVSFGFSSVNLRNPLSVQYRYRMAGLQSNWTYSEPNINTATFTKLPPGNYLLDVQARRPGATWPEASLTLPVSVLAPPWASPLAYALYALLLLALFAAIFQWRTRLLRVKSSALEQAVRDRTSQLEESESKVQAQAAKLTHLLQLKDRLFANVSHEFRTPLTLMLGPIEKARVTTQNPVIENQLAMAGKNGKRVLRLVDQLLELSRLESEQPVVRSPYPVSGVSRTVLEAFKPLARELGIQLSLVSDDGLWTEVPGHLMERLLMNLVSNAIKYTQPGGRVTLTAVASGDHKALISVEDTGAGIPEESQHLVFERFQRVEREHGRVPGSGIGLALVKEIVESYGGSINLDSRIDQGTCVTITLIAITPPLGIQVSDTESPSESLKNEVELLRPTTPADGGDRTAESDRPQVLVIEDNPDMRNYVKSVLEREYWAVVASNGDEGIEIALREVPDLVVCDLMMPGLDGFEVTQALRTDQKTSHIPIIMLTARSDEQTRLESLREHVDDFLVKPFNEEELILRVANLLAIRDIVRARYNADLFAGRQADEPPNALDRKFLDRLRTAMETHYKQSGFSIASMAVELAMSERQLQRKLKALTDQTPVHFLRIFRLERSLKLLSEGWPVGQVAMNVGFVSPAHFSSCFRAHFGCTPTEFQENPEQIHAH